MAPARPSIFPLVFEQGGYGYVSDVDVRDSRQLLERVGGAMARMCVHGVHACTLTCAFVAVAEEIANLCGHNKRKGSF